MELSNNIINYNLINNAVSDKHLWIYLSVNNISNIFKLNRNEIVYKIDNKSIDRIMIFNVYRWINNTWIKSWLWLHSINSVYKLEDAMVHTWVQIL